MKINTHINICSLLSRLNRRRRRRRRYYRRFRCCVPRRLLFHMRRSLNDGDNDSSSDNDFYDLTYQERGQTRSGRRFAQANVGHYGSIGELLASHQRLLDREAAVSSRIFRIGPSGGNLIQATLRYSVRHENIRQSLLDNFIRFFREHTENRTDGFEVIVTFNAVLANADRTSFSVFYGHDYRAENQIGAAPELRYGGRSYLIRTLGDVQRLPTAFDFEQLAETHRHFFAESGVSIARFLNIVYLVYRYVRVQRRRV